MSHHKPHKCLQRNIYRFGSWSNLIYHTDINSWTIWSNSIYLSSITISATCSPRTSTWAKCLEHSTCFRFNDFTCTSGSLTRSCRSRAVQSSTESMEMFNMFLILEQTKYRWISRLTKIRGTAQVRFSAFPHFEHIGQRNIPVLIEGHHNSGHMSIDLWSISCVNLNRRYV